MDNEESVPMCRWRDAGCVDGTLNLTLRFGSGRVEVEVGAAEDKCLDLFFLGKKIERMEDLCVRDELVVDDVVVEVAFEGGVCFFVGATCELPTLKTIAESRFDCGATLDLSFGYRPVRLGFRGSGVDKGEGDWGGVSS